MRYSQYFGKTQKKVSEQVKTVSHELLTRGGFIRESSAGRYYMLPLGMRVYNKIISCIRKQMDAVSQEVVTPVLHPVELWEQTNRTNSVGFELTTVKDRRGGLFVLGGTAEEMIVALVKQFNLSYRDLPISLYQFSSKFRDELRVRGGLLRAREFTMKDAYSFDKNEHEFRKMYEHMKEVYTAIFKYLGLKTVIVESDNGYIGGDYCHEFVVENPIGESRYLTTKDGSYSAHEDVAKFQRDSKNINDTVLPYQTVEAKRGTTMEDGVSFHHLPIWQQLKDVLYVTDKGKFILAILRGDLNVNEIKLAHAVNAYTLRMATSEEIASLGSVPGFLSPVGIDRNKTMIVGDLSLRTVKNAYGGANSLHKDALNINLGRDYSLDLESDIALAQEGFKTEDGKHTLIAKRGIEVGNIFQLGHHYSKLMNAVYTDENGKEQFFYMGCYGIGIGRTMAAIAEVHHDQKGILWPDLISPFDMHLLVLSSKKDVEKYADDLYQNLQEYGFSVLYDDRSKVSSGEKFADADLIGITYRLVVSEKTFAQGKIEYKKRNQKNAELITQSELLQLLKKK